MATLKYYLSTRIDELGSSEIYIRFCASREQIYRIKSGMYISVNRWSKKNFVIIPKIETEERKNLVLLDAKLDSLKKHVLSSYEEAEKTTVDKEWLTKCVDKFLHPEKYIEKIDEPNFFDVFNEFLEKRKLSDVRTRAFRVVYRSLQRYELFKQKNDAGFVLDLKNFTSETLEDIELFFRNEVSIVKKYPDIYQKIKESRQPEIRGQNTINDLFVKIRTFAIWCVKNNKMPSNPFVDFSVEESVYGTPYYISISERNQIYNTDISHRPQLEIQKDIFVFHCLVGCRVGDLFRLTKSNIINGALEYIARKTKDDNPVTVRVPLNSIALEILKKYEDYAKGPLLPFISEQKYNVAIKAIFTLAGITRYVTVLNPKTREPEQQPLNEIASSHLARRCFVGNLYKQVKDPNLVGSMSGHKEGSKAFSRYRDIDDDIKTDLVNLLL